MSIKKKSKLRNWVMIGVVVVLFGMIGRTFLKPEPLSYESVEAKVGDITNYYSFSGNIESKNRQTVLSDNVIQITDIKVKEGDQVKEGKELIRTTSGKKIKAKINGEIVDIKVEEDQQVMSGMELLEIVDYDNLQISVKVDEYDLPAVEKGKETTINIVALDKEITGTISSISKEGEIQNGITYFIATINLNKDDSLRIGMSTEVKLLNNEVKDIVTLPMNAIQFDDNNKPYVLKKGENDTPTKTEITTGINDGITVEIKKGVSKGETILYPKTTVSSGVGFGGPGGNEPATGGGINE